MDEGAATFKRRVLRWMRTAKRRINPKMVDHYPAVSWAKTQGLLVWVDCYSVLAIRWPDTPRGVRVLTDEQEKYLMIPLDHTGLPCHRFLLPDLVRAFGAPWEPARCRKRTHTDQCCHGWGMRPVPDVEAMRLRIGGRETVNRTLVARVLGPVHPLPPRDEPGVSVWAEAGRIVLVGARWCAAVATVSARTGFAGDAERIVNARPLAEAMAQA